jgi:hypothetical protein
MERRRREPTDFEKQVIADLAYLTSQMKGLVGNGQPGRIKDLEMDVQALKEHKARYSTYAVVIGGILTLVAQAAVAYITK